VYHSHVVTTIKAETWRSPTVMARRLRAAFVAATVAWAALIVAAAALANRAHASASASALIAGVYAIGSLVCHQRPERSFHLGAAQLPVCARCTGIYFGAVVGAVFALRASASLRRDGGSAAPPRTILAVAAAPTVLTLIFEWTTGVMPSHAIRAAAGAVIGVAVAWLVVAAAENQVN
jgi:Predicted membrane protein (DUF2085)